MAADLQSKKRKREQSASDPDGRPFLKQARSESPLRDTEDFPLSDSDAHKILTVLEAIDTDGLLDRLFKLPTAANTRTSFRALLQDPSKQSLRVVRDALKQLLPSSSQPRALLSIGASNQQRFYDFAQGLFDEIAADGSNKALLKRDSAFLSEDEEDAEHVLPFENRKRKYALVQRLPTGDWWSSATIPRDGDVGLTKAAAKALSIKQAELVSIIPSQPIPPEEMSLFSSLKPQAVIKSREDPKRSMTLPNKTLPAPKLLDYGVYSTFAPYFDSEGTEIGNDQIHQVVHESLQRRKARALRKQMIEKQKRLEQAEAATHRALIPNATGADEQAILALEKDADMDVADSAAQDVSKAMDGLSILQSNFPTEEALGNLQGHVPENEMEVLKQAFKALRAEIGVSELLEHNAIALDNLIRMQRDRLLKLDYTPSDLERQIASAIDSSLSLLISLRPRNTNRPDESVAPSAAILRALHRSIPATPTSGWRGTLATNRPTSLRDDATMYVKATARAQAAATAAAANGSMQQLNGAPRVPSTPTPATPVSQNSPYKTTPYHPNPNYSYLPSGGPFGYPSPSPGAPMSASGGGPRVIPSMMNPKGSGVHGSGASWPGYPGPMPPPYMGKMQPPPPLRTNSSFYKQ
ncbi:hypothetical protein M408DRAFT_198354 [Serendipita vermifera MAFF 305830]|uniref:Uncharacterized protein n=1 Tax=Serendipita vermifera MAFF 305830 TaxID=933852 RepID=A0A0C2WI11_SERVB|nr:hypothetical protein M408DRAFT_198354 [Serendipita vermifera MAFF 305830]